MRLKEIQFRLLTLLVTTLLCAVPAVSQVNIGEDSNPHGFSVLEISTDILKGGLRLPQLTTKERDALDINSSPILAEGLIIYNTDTNCLNFWNGNRWISLCASIDLGDETLEVTPGNLIFTSAADGGGDLSEIVETNVSAGWQIMSLPDWVTTNPSPNTRSTGTSLSVGVSGPNTGFLPRIGNVTVTAGSLSKTFTVTQEAPEAINAISSAPLLYVDADGKLQLGRWGMEITRNNLLNFKFGSVIGFIIPSATSSPTGGNASWEGANTAIKFNPSKVYTSDLNSLPLDSQYNKIPYYHDSLKIKYPSGTDISLPLYHNGRNVLAGLGDPCKLVGYSGDQIAAMTPEQVDTIQSQWRLPTKIENIQFVGADNGAFGLDFENYTPPPSDEATTWNLAQSANLNFWGGPPPTGNTSAINNGQYKFGGGWFPINTSPSTLSKDANRFLPVVGYRAGGANFGLSRFQGLLAFYWSSISMFNPSGNYSTQVWAFTLGVDAPGQSGPSAHVYPVSVNYSFYGFPIRCVQNTQ